MICQKYTIYWHNKKEDKFYNIIIELPHTATIKEGIRESLPIFNQKLTQDGSKVTFVEDFMLYNFYAAKKSGHPKSDYPGLPIYSYSKINIHNL